MAPTEVLARQHALTLEKMLSASHVRRAQLTGGLTPAQRSALLQLIAAGEVDVVVGTQAIIQEDVSFAKLGLVVIDEQHRFGVRQRARLKSRRQNGDSFARSALPGDDRHAHPADRDHDAVRRPGRLDPPRHAAGPAEGQHLPGQRRAAGQVVGLLPQEARARAGRATSSRRWSRSRMRPEAASLDETYETLANGELEAFRLGLIHGRMAPAEKDAVMDRFRSGEIAGAGLHFGGRGGRGRAQRHADDDRGGRAVRPGPVAPASRADQPGEVSRLLLRLRRPANRGIPPAAQGVRGLDRRLRSWPRPISSSAGRATSSARSSTGCRRCGSPTCCATRPCWKRPAATPSSSSRPTPAWLPTSTPGCGG